jgi:hypothetical protein
MGMAATQSGPTVFAEFKSDSDCFAANRQVMRNLRVAGLEILLEHLAKAGVKAGKAQATSPINSPITLPVSSPISQIVMAIRSN